MFALVRHEGEYLRDYYTGDTYVIHGERYAAITSDRSLAKVYTTESKAKNACEKLNNKIEHAFEVEKVDS